MKKPAAIVLGIFLAVGISIGVGTYSWRTSQAATTRPAITRRPKAPTITAADRGLLTSRFLKKVQTLFLEGTKVKMKFVKSRTPLVDQVLRGRVDIACMTRNLTDVEKLKELKEKPIGWQAYALVVNARNPLREVTLEQLEAILTGEIGRWNELDAFGLGELIEADEKPGKSRSRGDKKEEKEDAPGGGGSSLPNKRIALLMPSKGSDMYRAIDVGVLKGKAKSKNAKPCSSDYMTLKTVSRSSYSVGFITAAAARRADPKYIAVVKIDGCSPVLADVADGAYVVRIPIILCTLGKPKDELKDFIAFCLTPTSQGILDKYYFRHRAPRERRKAKRR